MTEGEFECFVTRHRASLVRLARSRMTGLGHEADNVVQDVLWKVWQTWDSERGQMLQFAIQCVINRANDYTRAEAIRLRPGREASHAPSEDWQDQPAERASLQADVAQAMDQIVNPTDKMAAWMIYAEGIPLQEVACLLGMPRKTLTSRMTRHVLPILRDTLAQYRRADDD